MPTTVEAEKTKQYKRFKKLPEDWRNRQMSEKDDKKLLNDIGRLAMQFMAVKAAKLFDNDLLVAKETLADINAGYKEQETDTLLRIEYLMATLRSQGKDVPSLEDFLNGAAGEVEHEAEREED